MAPEFTRLDGVLPNMAGGAFLIWQVAPELTGLDGVLPAAAAAFSGGAEALPAVRASLDHQSLLWCRQLVEAWRTHTVHSHAVRAHACCSLGMSVTVAQVEALAMASLSVTVCYCL